MAGRISGLAGVDEPFRGDLAERRVLFSDGDLAYDRLVVATGSSHHYFGNDQWETHAPGLKTIEDATEIRSRVLMAFEQAEKETDPVLKEKLWQEYENYKRSS